MYLYIVGRGHSGSTILDVLLGNAAVIAGVGELVAGMGNPTPVCSCGARVAECPFWSEVCARVEAAGVDYQQLAAASRAQAHVGRLLATVLARPGAHPDLGRLAAATRVLAAAITGTAGKPHLVDSGKEPTRALFLLKFLAEARLIHLVRRPHDVIASYYWRIACGEGVGFLRRRYRARRAAPFLLLLAAASWTVGNLIVEAIARTAPGRVVRVRYEDLRDRPEATVTLLGQELGLPLDDVLAFVRADGQLDVGHKLGGNGIRHAGSVQLRREAGAPRAALPAWLDRAVTVLSWPLLRRYGYRRPARGRVMAGTSA